MIEQPDPESLARWQYTPEEWRRFGVYEGRHYYKIIGQTKTAMIVFLILTILFLTAVPVFGFLKIAPWDRGMIVAVFVILLFGGGLIGICFIVWMMQRSKLSTLTATTGEVLITLTGISTSGIWHRWNYGDVLGTRFHDARIMTIKKGTPDEMVLLEVRTIANTLGGRVAHDVVSSCRVSVPTGKLHEAEAALTNILERAALRRP